MITPLISVVMPVWNGEMYLAEALDSMLSQTLSGFELIIVDDGSSDATLQILEKYARADSRIRIIRLSHEGIVVALNRGIAEAKSNWIARMDCDDVAHPERLEKQWRAVSRQRDIVLCHTNIELFGDPAFFPLKMQHMPRTESMLRVRLCIHCPITHPTVLMRKEAFLSAGGYMPEERHAEDYGLWGRMLPLGRFIVIRAPLLKFRVHGGSISKQAAENQSLLANKIRTSISFNLFQRDGKRAESLLKGISRQGTRPFTFGDSISLAKLLLRHGLLNAETTAWLGLNTLRAIRAPAT
ncbi:MAG: glycosyltransferase [Verrucomicrobiae bacterium]